MSFKLPFYPKLSCDESERAAIKGLAIPVTTYSLYKMYNHLMK